MWKMPRTKGVKRRSDSPSELDGSNNFKKYRTRSSRSVNYCENSTSEADDEEANKNSSGGDRNICAKQSERNSSMSIGGVKVNVDRAAKSDASNEGTCPVSVEQKLNRPISQPILFMPITLKKSQIQGELDLSDSDSSSSSGSGDEENAFKRASVSPTTPKPGRSNVEGEELPSSETLSDVWVKNLEAIQSTKSESACQQTLPNDDTRTVEHSIPHTLREATPSKKGKQQKNRSRRKQNTTGQCASEGGSKLSVSEMLKLEKSEEQASSEDDENWETVKPAKINETSESLDQPKKNVEIILEAEQAWKRKRKGKDLQEMIRLKINRVRKAIQLDLHQVSLVGMLAHGYLNNQMLNDPTLMATALSVIPSSGFPPSRIDLSYLEKLVQWVKKRFTITSKTQPSQRSPRRTPDIDALVKCIGSGVARNPEELVFTCVTFCRALGIASRLVISLQPLPAKVDPGELQGKEGQQKGAKRASPTPMASQKESGTEVKKKSTSAAKTASLRQKTVKSEKGEVVGSNHPLKKSEQKNAGRVKGGPSTSTKSTELPSTSSKSEVVTSPKQKRNRRKSREKHVKYKESSFEESDSDFASTGTKSRSSRRKSSEKKPTGRTRRKPEKTEKQSDDDYEESKSDESEDDSKAQALPKSSGTQLTKIISTDSEEHSAGDRGSSSTPRETIDVWLEVYVEQEEQWICVDVVSGQIHCERRLEKKASEPMLYVVAYNNDLTWKDVTPRYVSSFLSSTRKQRSHPEWTRLLAFNLERPSARSKTEDENMEKSLTDGPIPTSISELKGHPLYALSRHLLKFEAIYPQSSVPVGYVRSEPVYARECVKTLHSRETWLKEAKVVRVGEKPYKIVKARPKWDRQAQKMITDQPLELFGYWQVEDYIPPPAVDGKVPRNAYGNVELFLPQMLPKGTKHLQIPGLNKVARRLGIDCAPAMTGWDYHSGYSHPVYDGFVVCEEHVDTLMAAWQEINEEQEKREREKREKRVYGNWRRLIRGLLIKERIHAKYFSTLKEDMPDDNEDPPTDGKPTDLAESKKTTPPSRQQSIKKRKL